MPFTVTNARDHIWRTLRDLGDTEDKQLLTNTEIDAFIAQALASHALRYPVRVSADVTADGTAYTSLPTGWETGLSTLVSVEWPISQNPASIIDPRGLRSYLSATGEKLSWLGSAPATGTTVRYVFTASPVLSEVAGNTTLPDAHFYPVCDLAASICAEAIAAKYAQTGDPVINVDVAAYQKLNDWLTLARRLSDRYRMTFGLGSGSEASVSVAGYSTTVNWDSRTSTRADYLLHRRVVR